MIRKIIRTCYRICLVITLLISWSLYGTSVSANSTISSPVRNPSFWISRVEFVRNYQKIGDFWLPARNESHTQVKFFGRHVLTIDYGQYQISQATSNL